MHPQFVDLLMCPETREPLTLHAEQQQPNGFVVSGKLVSRSGKTYPIINGIPRFVARESYSKSWGFEWNFWPRVERQACFPQRQNLSDHQRNSALCGEGVLQQKLGF
jgi:uncharacterized protein YbaR (Trm112 family)